MSDDDKQQEQFAAALDGLDQGAVLLDMPVSADSGTVVVPLDAERSVKVTMAGARGYVIHDSGTVSILDGRSRPIFTLTRAALDDREPPLRTL